METTKPQTPSTGKVVKATKKAKVSTKVVKVDCKVNNLAQSIRLVDKDLLLALFPALESIFSVFPDCYRLEVNHGNHTKKFSVWYKPHGKPEEGYDQRTLKQYMADKAKGSGRIY